MLAQVNTGASIVINAPLWDRMLKVGSVWEQEVSGTLYFFFFFYSILGEEEREKERTRGGGGEGREEERERAKGFPVYPV